MLIKHINFINCIKSIRIAEEEAEAEIEAKNKAFRRKAAWHAIIRRLFLIMEITRVKRRLELMAIRDLTYDLTGNIRIRNKNNRNENYTPRCRSTKTRTLGKNSRRYSQLFDLIISGPSEITGQDKNNSDKNSSDKSNNFDRNNHSENSNDDHENIYNDDTNINDNNDSFENDNGISQKCNNNNSFEKTKLIPKYNIVPHNDFIEQNLNSKIITLQFKSQLKPENIFFIPPLKRSEEVLGKYDIQENPWNSDNGSTGSDLNEKNSTKKPASSGFPGLNGSIGMKRVSTAESLSTLRRQTVQSVSVQQQGFGRRESSSVSLRSRGNRKNTDSGITRLSEISSTKPREYSQMKEHSHSRDSLLNECKERTFPPKMISRPQSPSRSVSPAPSLSQSISHSNSTDSRRTSNFSEMNPSLGLSLPTGLSFSPLKGLASLTQNQNQNQNRMSNSRSVDQLADLIDFAPTDRKSVV